MGKQRKTHIRGQKTRTVSLQITTKAWATGRFLDIFERKARARPKHHQPVPNQYGTWWGHGLEVRGKGGMVWWWREGKRPILRFLPKPFWGLRPAGMIDHLKEVRLREEPLGACLESRERESIYAVAGRSATVDWRMKQTCLCLARVSGTQMNPLVVGKYAQTRQRRLKGKVVKTGHGRHYKRTLAMPWETDRKTEGIHSKGVNTVSEAVPVWPAVRYISDTG